MSKKSITRKFTITLKIPVEIEILRETDPMELGEEYKIDGKYNGWWWNGLDGLAKYHSTQNFCETVQDAVDEAKEYLQREFMKDLEQ